MFDLRFLKGIPFTRKNWLFRWDWGGDGRGAI